MQRLLYFALLVLVWQCRSSTAEPDAILDKSWPEIEAEARGTTVYFMLWQGDPYINAYLREEIVPLVDSLYNIDLQLLSGQGTQIVSTLMTEIEAGVSESQLDLCWINGETFYQLRQINGLFGPFVDHLPNSQYIDWENPFIAQDFQQPVAGMECPWGNVQQALIYDTTVMTTPPQNRMELLAYAQRHPGTITIPSDFTGMSFLKALLVDLAGRATPFQGDFNPEVYETYSTQLWAYLDSLRPYLWKSGTTFPDAVAPMHQLFANGELHLTMSMNDGEVDNKVAQGLFPESARAYVWATGTIQNSHYLGIPARSGNKAGAMVVINTLISPWAQWKKMDPVVWGDGTILDIERLPKAWQDKFADIPNRQFAPDRTTIQDRAILEFAPEYMIRLYEDFRTYMAQ
mgnify:CR=1 FL=1